MIYTTEVAVVGGSYAGLSAAMALGRSLRQTLIIDSGQPCNRMTPHAHNFITQDGRTPDAIRRQALDQVLAYPTVTFQQGKVVQADGQAGTFVLKTADGATIEAQRLLFATGLRDLLPQIEGVEACWGKTLIHCPYCHGYEVKGERTGIWMNRELALEYAPLIQHWASEVVLLTDGPIEWDSTPLSARGIAIQEAPIQRLEHRDGALSAVVLNDGTTVPLKALYHPPATAQHCTLPEELGCALTETGHLQVDFFQQTTVPGIYAAGDCTTPFRAVAQATAQGNTAGAMLNKSLLAT